MIISSISSLEELNNITYDDFLNNESLVQFSYFASYIINAGLISQFRNALAAGESMGSYIAAYSEQSGVSLDEIANSAEVLSVYELYTSGYIGSSYFIPYSKKDFISLYFSNMTPQLSESVFNLMLSTGRLNQIGSGGGKAFVLKPVQFTETHFQSLPVFKTSQELLDTAQEVINCLKSQIKDVNYYVQKIVEKDQIIDELNQHILELNNKINQIYQTTWR